jgi:hypothetical protein
VIENNQDIVHMTISREDDGEVTSVTRGLFLNLALRCLWLAYTTQQCSEVEEKATPNNNSQLKHVSVKVDRYNEANVDV